MKYILKGIDTGYDAGESSHGTVWNISLKELIQYILNHKKLVKLRVWNISLKELIRSGNPQYSKSGVGLKYILKGIDTRWYRWFQISTQVWNISLKELIHIPDVDTNFSGNVWNISLKELIPRKASHRKHQDV